MPVVTSVAAVGAAAVGAYASYRGSKEQAEAIQSGTNASVAEQRRQFDVATEMQKPWLETGQRALGALEKIYGIAPEQKKSDLRAPQGPGRTGGRQEEGDLSGRYGMIRDLANRGRLR